MMWERRKKNENRLHRQELQKQTIWKRTAAICCITGLLFYLAVSITTIKTEAANPSIMYEAFGNMNPGITDETFRNMNPGVADESSDETSLGIEDETLDSLDIQAEKYAGISFRQVLAYIKNADVQGLLDYILHSVSDMLVLEIKSSNTLIVQLMAVIILGSVFTNLSGRYGKMVGQSGFFVTYLMVVSLLLGIFSLISEIAVETITDITDLMVTFIPAYTLAVSYTNGAGSAEFAYQGTIFIIFLCEKVICQIVFPLAKCSGMIGLVNKMNTEDHFSKTVTLINHIAGWIIKTILAVVTGMNVIKGIIVPSVDKLERNAVLKVFGMLPGGNTVRNVSDILLGSGLLLKNAIGIAGAILVLLAALIPVVKIAVVYLMLRAVAALVQPLGDKRFSDGVNGMAQAIGLVLRGIWCAALLFIISLTVMTLLTK